MSNDIGGMVARLEAAATRLEDAAEILQTYAMIAKANGEEDQRQLQRLVLATDRLTSKVDAGAESNARIEAHAETAAEVAEIVAADLQDSHTRADQATGPAGAAADAASQSGQQ